MERTIAARIDIDPELEREFTTAVQQADTENESEVIRDLLRAGLEGRGR